MADRAHRMRILLRPTTSYSQPTRIPIASYRLLLASYPQECASSSCFTGLPGDVWTTLDSGSSQFRDPGLWTTLSHLARPARLHLNLLDLYVCILLCHILLDLVRLNVATPDSGRLCHILRDPGLWTTRFAGSHQHVCIVFDAHRVSRFRCATFGPVQLVLSHYVFLFACGIALVATCHIMPLHAAC